MTFLGVWALFVICLGASTIEAHSKRPVPDDQWSPSTAVWLARCQVAEAGWTSYVDHDSIAWVLARRWQSSPPGTRFETVIIQYCNSLDEHRPRAPWLRSLDDSSVPAGWPMGTRWSVYEPQWRLVRQRVEQWFAGEIPDPTNGEAVHWDSRDATAPKGCRLLEVNTRNAFYSCGR